MSKYFNDSPIERPDDDQYGISAFARAVATSLLNLANPVGTTIAINGPWGSGKSSAVNLIRNELDARKDEKLKVVDFRCWWYRGEEAIALAFLQELNGALKNSLGDRIKGMVPELGRHILQAGPGKNLRRAIGSPGQPVLSFSDHHRRHRPAIAGRGTRDFPPSKIGRSTAQRDVSAGLRPRPC